MRNDIIMRIMFGAGIIIILTTCGTVGKNLSEASKCTANGDACHVQIEGPAGSPGKDGKDGATGAQGPIGVRGFPGQNGATGSEGPAGSAGQAGADGQSCSVIQANNGALITCGITSVLVLNGTDGATGPAGSPAPQTAYTIVGILDPCGDKAGIYDEVFLRLADGRLVASFSDNANGLNTRFSILTPGSYVTTDNSHCYFSVDNDNQVFNEHY